MKTADQEKLVFWGYVLQWTALVIPPALIASLVYVLFVRKSVPHSELRSHVDWQLTTCGFVGMMIPIAFLLLFVGFSGVNTDAPISIVATFLLLGASVLFLPWLLYRLVWGTIRFSKELPMEKLFP